MSTIYPVYSLLFHHEGHEENEGKKTRELLNKVSACAIDAHKTSGPEIPELT